MRALVVAALLTMVPAVAGAGVLDAYTCGYGLKKAGCDTSFAKATSVIRVDETTLRVAAKGNARTGSQTIYRYTMRAAAQATLDAGYDIFTVQGDEDTSQAFVSGAGGNVVSFVRPGRAMTVRMSRGPKAPDASANVFDARDVLRFINQ